MAVKAKRWKWKPIISPPEPTTPPLPKILDLICPRCHQVEALPVIAVKRGRGVYWETTCEGCHKTFSFPTRETTMRQDAARKKRAKAPPKTVKSATPASKKPALPESKEPHPLKRQWWCRIFSDERAYFVVETGKNYEVWDSLSYKNSDHHLLKKFPLTPAGYKQALQHIIKVME